jgi:hypothetical protein
MSKDSDPCPVGHGSEGKSIWEDTDLSEKRFQSTQICAVKGHRFGGTVIL